MRQFVKLFQLFAYSLLMIDHINAQPLNENKSFSHADTLRGSYGSGRDWWDALKYDLHVKFNLLDSSISGYNDISLKILKKGTFIQIDLQDPMIIDSIHFRYTDKYTALVYKELAAAKYGNAYFIDLGNLLPPVKSIASLQIFYHGRPIIAKRPPWEGGLIFKRDKNNYPFVTIACQGLGASIWYPCKDHQSDKPDSAEMHITIPDTLVCVGNGRFRGKTSNGDGTTTYDWAVVNPINNYCIIPYIGKYVHFNEVYKGEKGDLDMDYWVLDYNLEKARKQFQEAPRMMKAFEYWFGPYPFYEDGYKLVEAPHLGMEHQSATAYGNGYQNGYRGRDLSGSGWGLKWDFIIVHESGHEWFANNITSKDIADMWVHEGFTNYSETLFTEYYFGKAAADAYIQGVRKLIRNDIPIIGPYDVNKEGSGDMYYKSGNMLHTIRQVISDDEKFRQILRGLNRTFYHQTVTTRQIEDYMSKSAKMDLSKIFDQYLRTNQVPALEYRLNGYLLNYRYNNCVNGFNLPLKVTFKKTQWIKPTEEWKTLNLYTESDTNLKVDPNFYINTKKVD